LRPQPFYHLALYTGARRGELLHLHWRDVDLTRAEMHITGSTAVIGGIRVEGTTKSGQSRTVSLDFGKVQVLNEHRARQAEERLTAGVYPAGSFDLSTAAGCPVGALVRETIVRLQLWWRGSGWHRR
jgi:integrase